MHITMHSSIFVPRLVTDRKPIVSSGFIGRWQISYFLFILFLFTWIISFQFLMFITRANVRYPPNWHWFASFLLCFYFDIVFGFILCYKCKPQIDTVRDSFISPLLWCNSQLWNQMETPLWCLSSAKTRLPS